MDRVRRRWGTFARMAARRLAARAHRFLFTEPDAAEPDRGEIAAASELARAAGDLKGGMAKVAQLMAYQAGPGAVDEEDARRPLAALWDHAPAVEPAAIRRVVVEDLGAPVEVLFARWDDRPFAAASLGQVHEARDADGRAWAVKVQYPGVAEALRSDLESRALVGRLAGTELGRALTPEAIVTLRDAVLGELDYVAEARRLARFGAAYERDPVVVIPGLWPERSGRRVLTAERLVGRPLVELAREGTEEERAAVALTIFRFAWGAPLRHRLLNADPNPGNYLVLDARTGRVGFLDFGCGAELDEELWRADRDLWRAILEGQPEQVRHAVYRQGLLAQVQTLDSGTYREWERALAAPFLRRGAFTWTPEIAAVLATDTSRLVRTGGLTLPPAAVLLWRQRLGAAAVIASLAPTARFRDALAELLAR